MAKILAVDDDALARAVLVDALRGMHHEVVPANGGRDALARLESGGFELVITDVMMPDMDGIELARLVLAREGGPPVLLSSGVRGADVAAEARTKGVEVAGFVAKPLRTDALGRAISRAMGAGRAVREGWSADDLGRRLEAPLAEQAPHQLLFLLHRVNGSGTMVVLHGEREVRIVVRNGRIVHVAGVPQLLGALGSGVSESGSVADAVGEAVKQGVSPDEALRAVAQRVGRYLASLEGEGTVRWELTAAAPAGSIHLPTSIPRLLSMGHRDHRPIEAVLAFWSTADRVPVRVVPPEDSPEARWGLDMTAQRVIRVASRYRTAGELIAAAVGDDPDRRPEVLRAVDFLAWLGVVQLRDTGADHAMDAGATPAVRDQSRDDALLATLRARFAAWEGQPPVLVLGLGGRPKVTLEELIGAWRDAAADVHPDRFVGGNPELVAAAAACFESLHAAHAAATAPGGLDAANGYLDAVANGRRYVSEGDRMSARVALRRGETLFRARDWKQADASFIEAVRLDPDTWPNPFYLAWCGWLSRRISSAEALQQLRKLTPKYPRQLAEVDVVVGTILKLEGKEAESMAAFRAATEKDPTNRDALRELRLQERRAVPVAAPGSGLLGALRRARGAAPAPPEPAPPTKKP